MMKKTLFHIALLSVLFASCDYDEFVNVYEVTVQLVYPTTYDVKPYEGARVELRDAFASIFVDSTDAQGRARFTVPSGIYSMTSANVMVKDGYRYICNGTMADIVVAPDSANHIELNLLVSRKRVVQ